MTCWAVGELDVEVVPPLQPERVAASTHATAAIDPTVPFMTPMICRRLLDCAEIPESQTGQPAREGRYGLVCRVAHPKGTSCFHCDQRCETVLTPPHIKRVWPAERERVLVTLGLPTR